MTLHITVHDPDYRTSLKDFNSFIESLQKRIIEIDETIPDLPLKDIVCRVPFRYSSMLP